MRALRGGERRARGNPTDFDPFALEKAQSQPVGNVKAFGFDIAIHEHARVGKDSIHVAEKETDFLEALLDFGVVHWAAFLMARRVDKSFGISRSGIMFGPSLRAESGSGCVSMNRPSQPAATAALARTGANSRWPLERSPAPPGS